ncbi:unnamed protein product [Psylliodes chrysocephalus]|uniref:Uncharacterized protein n=1 Tax=Psylliodes chrysocephalus TaxID=3402493 RepID=A0A9P0D7L7_9CUCU|nr:unnamed protein product [Psylliodes chrysocephala]
MDKREANVSDISIGSRKRKTNETRRPMQKKLTYKDDDTDLINFKKVCDYKGPTYRCENIAVNDVRDLRSKIFDTNNKVDQDTKLCHYMLVVPIDRKSPPKGAQSRSRNFSVHYFLSKRVYKNKI